MQYADDQDRGFGFFSDVPDGCFAEVLNPFDADALADVVEPAGPVPNERAP
ncbi:hypothetical protein L3Q65_14170 [Amycolatopsis sp. FU40]|uniref:hypothetical protein n=1 Tax=Amycolatopsis sp. FU40 TaxID=2914159 RepID=UPI001F3FEE6E|nr:hypothetical protein [Amycolatopsis sp. FU40]UKD57817.1 hypothetical protein L3Q65_14170 [Amycolatopsis sp. FU40]